MGGILSARGSTVCERCQGLLRQSLPLALFLSSSSLIAVHKRQARSAPCQALGIGLNKIEAFTKFGSEPPVRAGMGSRVDAN